MKKSEGNVAIGLVALMAVAMVSTVVYSSQRAKDAQHITKASETAGSEEGRSLEVLDNASHAWLNDEYNRARTWEYDVRYEIPLTELMDRRLLPSDFANRYVAAGESVYGLPYTTSVIKRHGSDDDEFNVLTTIGTRGVAPPDHPPTPCVSLFDRKIDGISQIGGAKGLSTSDDSIPWNGGCETTPDFLPPATPPWSSLPGWLISNWDLVESKPVPFPPQINKFSCALITDNNNPDWTLAESLVAPRSIDNFLSCVWADITVVTPPPGGGSCHARFTWRDEHGNIHPRFGILTWNNVTLKSYTGACSNSIRTQAYNDIMNDNGLNASTAGIPFNAGNYSCDITSTSIINCLLIDGAGVTPPGGEDDYCDVYVYNDETNSYDFDKTYTGKNCYGLL